MVGREMVFKEIDIGCPGKGLGNEAEKHVVIEKGLDIIGGLVGIDYSVGCVTKLNLIGNILIRKLPSDLRYLAFSSSEAHLGFQV